MAHSEPTRNVPSGDSSRQSTPKRHFPWKMAIFVFVVVIVEIILWRRREQAGPSAKQASAQRGGGAFPVAVIIGNVTQKDIPVYLDGLGTVQAFNTVTVRSRVDGQVEKLSFTEGQEVHVGDLLAQIDPAPFRTLVEQAEGKKAQDEAQLENARIILARDAALLTNKIVAREVYETQKAQVNQLAAAVKADQASLDSANVQLNYTKIAAPINGRAGFRVVDQGNIVRANDTNGIVVLTQLKPISVVFTLPEQNLGEIQRRFSSDMKVLAMDRDANTILDEGKLAVIDNQIDTGTGTIRLKATFPNERLSLWPGQFINTRLLLHTRTNAMVVPASVVQRGPEGAYSFVVREDMSVDMRPVKVALVEREQAVIESGLEPGERVVVDGQYKLQAGAKVKSAEGGKSEAEHGNPTPQTSTNRSSGSKKVGGKGS